jgi:hypothetical protein
MIEISFTIIEDGTSRTVGSVRVDDRNLKDLKVEALNPPDGRTVVVTLAALRQLHDEMMEAEKELTKKK